MEYLRAPSAAAAAYHVDLILTLPEDSTLANFTLQLAVDYRAPANVVAGAAAVPPASRSRVKSGTINLLDDGVPRALSFALSWGADVDVDLHVVTAGGTRIGFDHPQADGGRLSVDANAGCGANHDRAEKIEWGTASAPRMGIYRAGPNYYEACGGFAQEVAVTLVINNGRFFQRCYRFALSPADENQDARLDEPLSIYTGVLPPRGTDLGLLARLLVNENPPPGTVPRDQLKKGMQAVQAVVFNRLASKEQRITNAPPTATLGQVITASGQFQGFSGGMEKATERRVDERMTVLVPLQAVSRPYWEDLFAVLNGDASDPFAALDKIGAVSVRKGAWALYTFSELRNTPRGPGGSYVPIPAAQDGVIAGNQFYTLPADY
ncbi:hypothetical protein [Longimicrobium sp.]|uniref:hypothetical protein n=1 Tax=Longimicrobium sp. TaxID=2029185 RepID=UPI002D7E913B|nr:hypothetical protein [Longimicrobium sp.]